MRASTTTALAMLACVHCAPATSTRPTAQPAAQPESAPVADASLAASLDAEQDVAASVAVESPPAAPGDVDLLHAVSSTIAVSSTVRNNSDMPEHLTDGDLTTAWNSVTGALTTSWIDVSLPTTVTVHSVRMTAGYTKVNGQTDLFAMNRRVQAVRIVRAGAPPVEFTLDTESRALQPIAVNIPGGNFRIEIVRTIVGTRPSWREVCVSELEVWGTVDVSAPVSTPTAVAVGAADAGEPTAPVKIAPTFALGSNDEAGLRAERVHLALVQLAGLRAELHAQFEAAERQAREEGACIDCHDGHEEDSFHIMDAKLEVLRAACADTAAFRRALRALTRARAGFDVREHSGRNYHPEYQEERDIEEPLFEQVVGACPGLPASTAARISE